MTPEEQIKQLQQQLELVKTQKDIADVQASLQQRPAEIQKAIAEAESAAALARKSALEASLPKGESKPLEGTVTTDEKFGYLATLVTYQVMRECATTIAKTITENKSLAGNPVKILIVDERNVAQSDLALVQVERQFAFFRAQFDVQVKQMDGLLQETVAAYPPAQGEAQLEVQQPDVGAGGLEMLPIAPLVPLLAAAPAVISSVADIVGYFKTDYTVKGQTVDLSGDALVAEVAGKIKGHHIQIFNFNLVEDSELVTRWSELVEQKLALDRHKELLKVQVVEPATARIASRKEESAALQAHLDQLTQPEEEAQRNAIRDQMDQRRQGIVFDESLLDRAQRAVVNANTLAQAFGEFMTSLTSTSDPASQPLWLQTAVRQQIRRQGITHLLYLKIVSSGGEAITKKSFLSSGQTSYLGGAAVAYVLAAADGKVELAGTEVGLEQLDYRYSQPNATTLRKIS
jgi:hypothetical protein